jgi:transcriptional regulator with XRE-family HTH domain
VQGFDGQMLRARRERAGLAESELARCARVAPQDVSEYESGNMKPGPGRLAALAECLGVKPLDLVDRSELGEGLKALRAAAGFTQAELVSTRVKNPKYLRTNSGISLRCQGRMADASRSK